ncbi:hypothetical protein LY474_07120 [Myxococcus stipitatus]|uniref:hypothetical protein n=1 Tax=Myxococcus stipitatus TaxID=83455 RepID=UPI001F38C01C|nr:hypothetical protein [Myxococcus stipitatus]MCE9667583.1 hypothetical protein [Myxococcus stipitatus]
MLVPAVALGCALLLAQTPGPEAPQPIPAEAFQPSETPRSGLGRWLPQEPPGEATPPSDVPLADQDEESAPTGATAESSPPAQQAETPTEPVPPEPRPELPLPVPPSLSGASGELPMQNWSKATVCLRLAPTAEVPSGRWRAQCDEATRTCLVAPDRELDIDGVESSRRLERTSACVSEAMSPVPADLLRTYRLVAAIAESPPGWYRDERGRVMQFNFDLNRRIWLGGAWSPLSPAVSGAGRRDRARLDFGIALDVSNENTLHRLRFLETEVSLGEPSVDLTMARYDFSIERDDPAFRITTFLGEPRRHDIFLNLGMWFELLRVEQLEREDIEAGFITWGTVHGTLDLWHSRDLVSYVRLRAGAGMERDYLNDDALLVPGAVLEADLTLDRDGFHHLRFSTKAEKLLLSRGIAGRPDQPERLRVQAGYELILLAINDQPLSLVVDGRGTWRNDIPGLPHRWEWSASAGLRFSLWAPPRRDAPLADRAKD